MHDDSRPAVNLSRPTTRGTAVAHPKAIGSAQAALTMRPAAILPDEAMRR
jgi:hypothetical protein